MEVVVRRANRKENSRYKADFTKDSLENGKKLRYFILLGAKTKV